MRRGAAADGYLGALLLARLQHADDLVPLAFGHDRADGGGGIVGVAHRHRTHAGGERVDHLLIARLRRQDAGLRGAGLPVVHQSAT